MMPSLTDKLFIASGEGGYDYASINQVKGTYNEMGLFYLVEGYRTATMKLFDLVTGETKSGLNWLTIDSLIHPILFNFRHYLELILKDTIRYYKILNSEVYSDEIGFKPGHYLADLWVTLRPYLDNQYCRDSDNKEDLNAVENLIKEIHSIDTGSFAFRYPFNTNKNERGEIVYTVQPMTINLPNLRAVCEKLMYFFDSVNMDVANLLDIKSSTTY